MPAERSFYFRGADAKLNLRAGDDSRWLRWMIKDAELADEVGATERDSAPGEDFA